MLFLSEREKREWAAYADEILLTAPAPGDYDDKVCRDLVPAFHFYVATILAAKGSGERSLEWLETGARTEEDGLSSCTYLRGFLERHENRLTLPAVVFQDPRPFIHFAGIPMMKEGRRQFVRQCGHSLPAFNQPIRCIDIGCGNGELTAALLLHLMETGKVPGISEILLVDPSPAMAELAQRSAVETFPDTTIRIENCRIQDYSDRMDRHFDIAISSHAYHHIPLELKRVHLSRMKPWIDHFLLFELDANHDTPDLFSPDLSFSLYQSYGRIIDNALSQHAPVEGTVELVDSFLMTELVSMLTQPRGVRTDYHMLRSQWNSLFQEVLCPEFSLRCDSAAYADEYVTLFTMHYGREQ
jgi:SAM-dependent methyltransferase